jgi:hypothetical protein
MKSAKVDTRRAIGQAGLKFASEKGEDHTGRSAFLELEDVFAVSREIREEFLRRHGRRCSDEPGELAMLDAVIAEVKGK